MWPGPGLVVMALAFISVARRGISQIIHNQGNKLGKVGDENTGSLARVNPWLSACDLAQPNSAPDLQGQCSAGTLPVALVNEGPGPPECPPSCETLRLIDRNTANNNNNKMEENRFNEKQQCLDYFGDNEESSPAQICKKSSRDIITTKLRSLRLRHCCERSAFSAILNDALVDIYKGGADCIRTLNDLLDADALASRITCELNEILVRYDCRQPYSIKHACRDCKEAYRRWVCSTLIPYFAEPDDIRQNLTTVNKNGNTSSTKASSSSRSSRNVNDVKEHVLTGLVDHEKDPVLSRLLKRSRRKTETIRKKIRPCLSVCQTVEENCPYMLPGDRAPAHPTQYAGEPTFLCLVLTPIYPSVQLTVTAIPNDDDNSLDHAPINSPATNTLNNLTTEASNVLQSTIDKNIINQALDLISKIQNETHTNNQTPNFNNNFKDEIDDDDFNDLNLDDPLLCEQDISFNLQPPTLVPAYLNVHYVCESGSRLLFLSVYWTKRIQAFKVLSEETQVTLLRNAWVEIFALGLAQFAQTLSIPTIMSSLVNYVKTVISQEKVPPNGLKKIVEHVWKLQEFVCGMNRLELDECEYAYLKIISLFNADNMGVHPNQRPKIEKVQELAVHFLKSFTNKNMSHRDERIAKLLLKTSALRSLDPVVIEDLFFTNLLIGQVQIENVIPFILKLGGAGVGSS